MPGFKTTVELLTKSVEISELYLKDIKDVLKSFMYVGEKPIILQNTLNSILRIRTSLTAQEIEELNIVDYIILLISLKSISASGTTKLTININNTPSTLNLDTYKIIDILKAKTDIEALLQDTVIQGVCVKYKLPTMLQVLESTNTIDVFLFVDSININNSNSVCMNKLSIQEKRVICDKLPLLIKKNIDSTVSRIYKHFSDINLLEPYNFNGEITLPFSIESKTFTLILSIIFNENLMTIYENMFMLCKYANMSAEYLESVTPGEYAIFVSFLEKIIASTNAQRSDST